MGRGLKNTISTLGVLIVTFAGCLIFQVFAQNWIISSYNDMHYVTFFFLIVVRVIVSIIIAKYLFNLLWYELPGVIAKIAAVVSFGYLMVVVPILSGLVLMYNVVN